MPERGGSVMRSPHELGSRRGDAIALGIVPALALLVALGMSASGAKVARAEESITPPAESGKAPEVGEVGDPMPSFDTDDTSAPAGPPGHGYVAEIVDSSFLVGPAEFLALDLPPNPPGARAVHLLGTVNVADKKGDIMIRLFTASAYQGWLKKRGGEKANAFWASKRQRAITLDQDLPADGPFVLLLDNGYSVRTRKHVRAQLQLQYQRTGAVSEQAAQGKPAGEAGPDDLITPRANTDEEIPPPPPPPPSDDGNN
jgi:hypothetical protein